MSKRLRKFLSVPLILLVIYFWAWGALAVYETYVATASIGWVLTFFGIAGLGWFFPAAAVISWAERSDAKKT